MDRISKTKQEIRHAEWQKQYEAYQNSGQPLQKWCEENGINIKTFYYRLRKVREKVLEQTEKHEIVPISTAVPIQQNECICITASGMTIEIPNSTSSEMLCAVIASLKKC